MEHPARKDDTSNGKVTSDGKDSSKTSDSTRQNISFKFTKSSSKKLVGNKLDEDENPPKKELIISVQDKEIKSAIPREEKKELVIPLIRKNTWRISEKTDPGHEGTADDKEKTLHEMALKEVLKESSMENDKWEKREAQTDIMIPLVVQNKVPEGYETDAKVDVSLRPDESTLEDYEKVPVDAFGLAVLRGMGWKPGEAIGGKNKQCVKPVEPVLRPKGLGLGADKNALKKGSTKESGEEKLELLKKSYVRVNQGTHEGLYGQVEGLDDENARVVIKLTTVDKCVTLPEFFVEVVSKKEFQKESKVINKLAYDKYQEENKGRREYENGQTHDGISEDNSSKRKGDQRTRDASSDSRESSHHKKRKQDKERKSEKSEKSEKNASSSVHREKSEMWVSTQLKVRFIDAQYKKGKYYNQKMIVEDILSPKYCVCKTEDGKYLDDVRPSMLETVIPRSDPAYIMIVLGKHKGQLGVILKKDKTNCIATVQLLADREKVTKLEYDSICEYTGDVSQFD